MKILLLVESKVRGWFLVSSRELQSIACHEHTRAFKFPLLCSPGGRPGVAKSCKDQFDLLYKLLLLLSL